MPHRKEEIYDPMRELLNRIHWDPKFRRGEFKIDYLDPMRSEPVYVPPIKCCTIRATISVSKRRTMSVSFTACPTTGSRRYERTAH